MALCFNIKLFDLFTIIHFFSVDLLVTNNNTLPNTLSSFLEIQIQKLIILYWPKAVVYFYLLT
jgi:hypothetical protein